MVTMRASDESLVLARYTGGVVINTDEEYEHQISADLYSIHVLSNNRPVIKLEKSVPIALGPNCQLEWIDYTNISHVVST